MGLMLKIRCDLLIPYHVWDLGHHPSQLRPSDGDRFGIKPMMKCPIYVWSMSLWGSLLSGFGSGNHLLSNHEIVPWSKVDLSPRSSIYSVLTINHDNIFRNNIFKMLLISHRPISKASSYNQWPKSVNMGKVMYSNPWLKLVKKGEGHIV